MKAGEDSSEANPCSDDAFFLGYEAFSKSHPSLSQKHKVFSPPPNVPHLKLMK